MSATSELAAQVEALKAAVAELLRQQAQGTSVPAPPAREAPPAGRVPTGMPKFRGKKGDDVRQWLFQVTTACRIHNHVIDDDNRTLPEIASTALEPPASGWYLHWSSITQDSDKTWKNFCDSAKKRFEANDYQAILRENLRKLKQTSDVEDYNGRYAELVFRIEDMSEMDKTSNYISGLKPKTRAHVKLQGPSTLEEAMSHANSYEHAHFDDDDHQARKVTISRDGNKNKSSFSGKKHAFADSTKPKKYSKSGNFKAKGGKAKGNSDTKRDKTCFYCKKVGHFEAECRKKARDEAQGNDQAHQ